MLKTLLTITAVQVQEVIAVVRNDAKTMSRCIGKLLMVGRSVHAHHMGTDHDEPEPSLSYWDDLRGQILVEVEVYQRCFGRLSG